jgi:ABC-type amino acid transport system permease subunit
MNEDIMTTAPAALPRLPVTVAWLGYGGLLPFLFLAPLSLIDQQHGVIWSDALYGYGAIIVSFIGALHWGFAIALRDLSDQQRSALFIWSVVPALMAWPALMVSPILAGPLLILAFIAHYVQDYRLASKVSLPEWYLPLRFRLTSVACICLLIGIYPSTVGQLAMI